MRRNVSIPKLPDPQIFLTGKKLTQEQIAPRKPRRRSECARCKPQADHLAQIQKEILAIQQ
jgi:hypothetical protein